MCAQVLKFLVLFFAFFALWPGSLRAEKAEIEPVELSLGTLILFAVDNDPDLQVSKEKKEQLDYFQKEARSDYYPQIQLDIEGGREYIDPTSGQNSNNTASASVILNQKLFDGFKTINEVRRRGKLIASAEQDIVTVKESLILEVVDYYLDILRFQEVTRVTEDFVVRIDEIVATVADMYEAGAAGKAMLDYARSRQASAYVDLNESRSSLNEAVSNLEFLTGPLPPFLAVFPDQLYPENLRLKDYIRRASKENAFIKKSQAEIEAMKYQLAVEKGEYYPSLDLSIEAEQGHDQGGEVGVDRELSAKINLSYEIFDGFNKKSRVSRAESQVRELRHRDRKVFNSIKRDINLAYNQILALRASISTTREEIRANTALQLLNQENFRLGSLNVIELIEGEERLQDARVRKLRLQKELHENIYNLLAFSAYMEKLNFCTTCESLLAGIE